MPLEARVTPIWKKQKLFVAIFLLAAGGWFIFDGTIGYPATNARYAAWKPYHDAGDEAGWKAFAAQHGWVQDEWTAFVKKHEWKEPYPAQAYTSAQVRGQFIYGTLGAVLGLIALAYWLTQKGRVLRLDDEAVTTPAGNRVPFSAITGLGLKNWDAKGLATVRYEIDGRKGAFEIDDYKFDTEPTRKILDEIKTRLAGGK